MEGEIALPVLHHNTIVMTGSSTQGFICHGGCGLDILTMRNNIVQATWKVGYADAAFDGDFNLYYGGQRQFTLGGNDIVAAPGFVSGGYQLSADSPAVDAGAALSGYLTDLAGNAVPVDGDGDGSTIRDIGAYEHQR